MQGNSLVCGATPFSWFEAQWRKMYIPDPQVGNLRSLCQKRLLDAVSGKVTLVVIRMQKHQ